MVRRRLLFVTGVITALALAVLLGWNVAWPHYRPGLDQGELYAVDVSSHQGAIDWAAVASDDINAAYIKASEGATWRDRQFEQNWTAARSAGLAVGAYHFYTLCRSGAEQAANLLDQLEAVGAMRAVGAAPASDTLPVAVDLELSGNCSERPQASVVDAQLAEFAATVEAATGQEVVVYALDSWTGRYPLPDRLEGRARWVRQLGIRPDGEWVWWQVHNRARVDGITGPVDLNVVRDLDG